MLILVLFVIFMVLAMVIGGDRTAKTIVTLLLNGLVMALSLGAMYMGVPPLAVSIVAMVLVSLITLFFQNEVNQKTAVSFVAVLVVNAAIILLIFFVVYQGHLQGMSNIGQQYIRESNGFSGKIGLDMYMIQVAVILATLVGAVIDAAISVVSGIYQVAAHRPDAGSGELFLSGIRISKSILSSTVNTLFFIFAGEYLLVFVDFMTYYSFTDLINSKEFAQGSVGILISALGSILVMPIASFLAAKAFGKREGSLGKER